MARNDKKRQSNSGRDARGRKAQDSTAAQELTDEQIAAEEEFMKGVPYFNLGAMFMPAIWGPGHGSVITILFYPLWLFCDNIFWAAYSGPSPLSIGIALVVFVSMVAFTLFFARMSQPIAWHRAAKAGKTKEQYIAGEKKWAVGMAIVAIIFLALATWFNLSMRSGLSA